VGTIADDAISQLLSRRRPRATITVDLVDGETADLVFEALGRREYDSLVELHPRKDDKAGWAFDLDTFAPALISACSAEPKLTVEQAEVMFNEWEMALSRELFLAVLELNTARPSVPKGLIASAATEATG
jgi:hypothetical protein